MEEAAGAFKGAGAEAAGDCKVRSGKAEGDLQVHIWAAAKAETCAPGQERMPRLSLCAAPQVQAPHAQKDRRVIRYGGV